MGLSPEELASKDLGGAQMQMEEQHQRLEENAAAAVASARVDPTIKKSNTVAGKKALQALIQTNKFLSLGAMVGGATSKDQPSDDPDKLGVEKAAEDDFEDCYDWGRQIG